LCRYAALFALVVAARVTADIGAIEILEFGTLE
jgi:hypothetical protein